MFAAYLKLGNLSLPSEWATNTETNTFGAMLAIFARSAHNAKKLTISTAQTRFACYVRNQCCAISAKTF